MNIKSMYRGVFLVLFSALVNPVWAGFTEDLVKAALDRATKDITYDGGYRVIDYPNGDVASNIGVCTDVVIRSYRSLGIDLQVLVHEDMSRNFSAYPSKRIWGMNRTDTNIDHRRVPNLAVFFERNGQKLQVSSKASDYKAGDLVTWSLAGNLPHIGIVSDKISPNSGNPLIVHNIGSGPKLEDMLFSAKITGHYRFQPNTYAVQ